MSIPEPSFSPVSREHPPLLPDEILPRVGVLLHLPPQPPLGQEREGPAEQVEGAQRREGGGGQVLVAELIKAEEGESFIQSLFLALWNIRYPIVLYLWQKLMGYFQVRSDST